MRKLSLKLDNLVVETFATHVNSVGGGTVVGREYTESGCPQYTDTCVGNETCAENTICSTCLHTCEETCNDFSCGPFSGSPFFCEPPP